MLRDAKKTVSMLLASASWECCSCLNAPELRPGRLDVRETVKERISRVLFSHRRPSNTSSHESCFICTAYLPFVASARMLKPQRWEAPLVPWPCFLSPPSVIQPPFCFFFLSLCRCSRSQKLAEQFSARRPQLPGGSQLCVRAHRPLLSKGRSSTWRWRTKAMDTTDSTAHLYVWRRPSQFRLLYQTMKARRPRSTRAVLWTRSPDLKFKKKKEVQ